jgi:hypothetical protein
VLVRKKNEDLRLCVDYRRLNTTKKDCFPLQRINNTLDAIAVTKWFAALELKNGCWQVALHPDDKKKTEFSTG